MRRTQPRRMKVVEGLRVLPGGRFAWVAPQLRNCTRIIKNNRVWDPFIGPIFRRSE